MADAEDVIEGYIDPSFIEGQFCEVSFGAKWVEAYIIVPPFLQHGVYWAKIVLHATSEEFADMTGQFLLLPVDRVRVPHEFKVNGSEVEAIMKQYCTVINELTEQNELNSIEAEVFKIRIGSFLDKYLALYSLPSATIFGGTPTLLKLIAYIIILEKLENELKEDKRFVHARKLEIQSVIDCALEVLKFYVCALCENQREMYPEAYDVVNNYEYSGHLASGVEKGLMGLEGPSNSVVRNTIRFFRPVKVYTLTELTTKLLEDVPVFTEDYFLNYPHDVILVPEDTNFLMRAIQNNPRTTFWMEAAMVGGVSMATGGVALPLLGGFLASTAFGSAVSKYFGLSEHKKREAKQLLEDLKKEQEEQNALQTHEFQIYEAPHSPHEEESDSI